MFRGPAFWSCFLKWNLPEWTLSRECTVTLSWYCIFPRWHPCSLFIAAQINIQNGMAWNNNCSHLHGWGIWTGPSRGFCFTLLSHKKVLTWTLRDLRRLRSQAWTSGSAIHFFLCIVSGPPQGSLLPCLQLMCKSTKPWPRIAPAWLFPKLLPENLTLTEA